MSTLEPQKQPTIGVLLIHGLNGSPHDLAEMEELLQTHGLLTHNMLLPGHGTHVRDLMPLGWSDWERAVRHELTALQQRCDRVFLVGHCLGGALALHAAAHAEVAGVVSMCSPLQMYPTLKLGVSVLRHVVPALPTIREDVRDPHARRGYTRNVYRWTALSPAQSLIQFLPQLQAELPQITVPVLVMASQHDHVIPVSDGRKIYALLGSQHKELLIVRRSYHVIMKDYDRAEVFARAVAFIQCHANQEQHSDG
ncbi:MAG: alpha/beta fold hydrolase [Ktedonobacteraceae bacterium]|nr:alpha/beta fold hydrolase [Ktedonobacteraceae bacterium]